MIDSPTHYTTIVDPVLEVTLTCRGDAAPWRHMLAREGITLPNEQKQIEIILSAAEMKYKGVQFREFSVSLRLDAAQAFLVYAFNSNRFFAWVERAIFHTPYHSTTMQMSTHQVQVMHRQQRLLEATLPDTASVTDNAAECEVLQVWLPSAAGQMGKKARYFNARLEGDTQCYAVAPGNPVLSIGMDVPAPLQPLRDSTLTIEKWSVRARARHSKSHTFTRE